MKEEEDFCPILKRVRRDTMQLVKRMTETEGGSNGKRSDLTGIPGADSPGMEAARTHEETAIPLSVKPKGHRPQTLEDMFDLTKGRFPCDRK